MAEQIAVKTTEPVKNAIVSDQVNPPADLREAQPVVEQKTVAPSDVVERVPPSDIAPADPCANEPDPIAYMLCRVIEGLVAVVDGFVTVLQQNAQTLAELTILGGMLYATLRLGGSAIGKIMGVLRA